MLSRLFDWLITALIMASVVIVFASTFNLPRRSLEVLSFAEGIASVVFTIEYVLRILTADFLFPKSGKFRAVIKYVFSPMAIVDLVAILPFWLPMFFPGTMLGLRALRLVRLLRIFKLNRYFDAMKSLSEVIVLKRRELLGSMFFVCILMLISSLLMYSAEHEVQPDVFRNAFSGLWWAVATLTTVGYGDIYPVTPIGRLVGAFIAFSGLAAVAIPTGIISSGLTERISKCDKAKNISNESDVSDTLRKQGEILKDILAKLSKSN
jgi:voltage-gated potassium channel